MRRIVIAICSVLTACGTPSFTFHGGSDAGAGAPNATGATGGQRSSGGVGGGAGGGQARGGESGADAGVGSTGGTGGTPGAGGNPATAGSGGENSGGATAGGAAGYAGNGGAPSTGGSAGSGGTSNVNGCERANWTATASSSSLAMSPPQLYNPPAYAIDGDLTTRWSTGQFQTPKDWFQVDLGGVATLTQVKLDTSGSPTDAPVELSVQLSTNGTDFRTVATTTGSAVVAVAFPATSGRYLRLLQTGSSATAWWSIDELTVTCSPL